MDINDKEICINLDIGKYKCNLKSETLYYILNSVIENKIIQMSDEVLFDIEKDEYLMERLTNQFNLFLNNSRNNSDDFNEFNYAFQKTFKKYIYVFLTDSIDKMVKRKSIKDKEFILLFNYIKYIFLTNQEDNDKSFKKFALKSFI